MENNFIYASYTRRFFSNIIDGAILLILIPFITIKCNILNILNSLNIDIDTLFLFSYIVIYHSLFISSSWQGTPGQKLCIIKVVDSEGSKLGFSFSVLRSTLALISYIIVFIICDTVFTYVLVHTIQDDIGLIGTTIYVFGFPLICLLALFLIYFSFRCFNKKRTFYDMVSRSYVVELPP